MGHACLGASREEGMGWNTPPAPAPAGGPRRSVWFRQYSFWGWQDSLDYSSLVSLPSRLARGRGPATQTRPSTWRRSSVQPLWRAATKQMARNERLRFPCMPLHVRAPWCPCQRRVPGGSVRDEETAAGGSGTASTWTARRSKSSSARCWILRCSTQARSACGHRRYWYRLPALSALLPCSPCPAPIQVPALRVLCSLG
jgi:hypothetical protein